MPLVEMLPVGTGVRQWPVWGTVARVVTDDPACADDAAEIVRGVLADVDQACSRFRADSEIRSVGRALGRPVRVSDQLRELVATALDAARATGGDVDPTVGAAMCARGYDRDFAAITDGTAAPTVRLYPTPDWRAVRLDGKELTVPAGVELDLGATAKAWAADRAAARVSAECGTGVLVALGGDIATSGRPWQVLVQDGAGEPASTIRLPAGAALATSSTISRAWRHGGRALHHILDPRTGAPAPRVWRTASVAAFDCVRANTLSTAALVRGGSAERWLRAQGVPARLVAADGTVTTSGSWPVDGDAR
jgi:thiamine biosynthesis lipoprotein